MSEGIEKKRNKDLDRKRKSSEREKNIKASEDVSFDHRPPPAKIQRTGPFISSLFKSNPDIPKVDSSSVQTIKEEVFTSKKFGDLPLSPNMITNLEDRMNMKNMTTVQQLAIPRILQGQDALVKSQTGSGKTLAYAVPIVQKLQSITPKIDRSHGPYAIVVVPTRELATQSYEVFMKVCKPFVYVVPGCLMGGEKRKAEKARIRRGINVLVGTPGRLVDHLQNTHGLSVKHVQYLVLDEADRLLDMGYEKDVAQIVNSLNDYGETKRQTILLSATLSEGVERLAGMSLSNPAHVSVSSDDVDHDDNIDSGIENDKNEPKESFAVPQELKQHFVITPCKLRLVTLVAFILSKCRLNKNKSKMIVFLSTQDSVEFHHKLISDIFCKTKKKKVKSKTDMKSLKFDLFKLHGDMAQKERNEVFKKFSEISSGVLLCTDVAARGLDLPQVSWIVQYTTPGQTSDYIHRVGRTARVGSQGQSLLFLIPSEVNYIKQLNDKHISLKEMQMKNILESLMTVIEYIKFPEENKRQKPRMWEEAATAVHQLFEMYVAKHPSMTELSRRAYQSFIRAYATYPSHMKHIFSIKKVHLGHLAKSFALREAPGSIGVVQAKKYQEDHAQDKKDNRYVISILKKF
ncbi:hypothetical protein LOTGIDRAFT_120211 [Lottia gigantea]|uniref:ATP-dependent RNA helicase n=1 Tax=Lottia gigantea TaxID=225164 RepID=V4A7M3_LOTGI|nr:hypothetical protein LOTGIDRAFT_120211 [Lottia gigantea]ESO92747.1 hypothetical protein LOTGIDRAFT_120211 [Lottia gigantea]